MGHTHAGCPACDEAVSGSGGEVPLRAQPQDGTASVGSICVRYVGQVSERKVSCFDSYTRTSSGVKVCW